MTTNTGNFIFESNSRISFVLFDMIIQSMFGAKNHWTLGTGIGKYVGEMLGLDVILQIKLSVAAVLTNITH